MKNARETRPQLLYKVVSGRLWKMKQEKKLWISEKNPPFSSLVENCYYDFFGLKKVGFASTLEKTKDKIHTAFLFIILVSLIFI